MLSYFVHVTWPKILRFHTEPLMNLLIFATFHSLMKDVNLIDSCQAHLPAQCALNIKFIRQKWHWYCDWQRATPESHVRNKHLVCSIGCPCLHWLFRLFVLHSSKTVIRLLGLGLAKDPTPTRGNFVHYEVFLKLHYIRHKIKDVIPLRVAALTCNITLYTLHPERALNVPDNVSTMTSSYIFACWHRFMNFL